MSTRSDLRRAAPWVVCALSIGALAVSAWLRWRYAGQGPPEHVSWLEGVIGSLGFAGIPVVGALIASRLPGNPYGWVWCGAGLAYAVGDIGRPLVRLAGWPPWAAWLFEGWGFVTLVGLLVFVYLLFPTGRLPGPRWRWVARGAVAGLVLLAPAVPFISDPAESTAGGPWAPEGAAGRYVDSAALVVLYALFGLALAAMSSLVLRFRRAGAVERRQLTWFLYATLVNGAVLVLDPVLGVLPLGLTGTVVSAASTALLPVAVGIAVLRYRLYQIDRIVSRTVSYGLLSGGLACLYLALVALLRPLLEPVTGSSALAVAGSTLAVAAVFHPARRRLQAGVDRRFDRARYDAGRAAEAFAARLRTQVDLAEVVTGLREAVATTVAPSSTAVWVRPSNRR